MGSEPTNPSSDQTSSNSECDCSDRFQVELVGLDPISTRMFLNTSLGLVRVRSKAHLATSPCACRRESADAKVISSPFFSRALLGRLELAKLRFEIRSKHRNIL